VFHLCCTVRTHLYFHFGLLMLSLTACSTFEPFLCPPSSSCWSVYCSLMCAPLLSRLSFCIGGHVLLFLVIAMPGLWNRFSFYVVDSVRGSCHKYFRLSRSTFVCFFQLSLALAFWELCFFWIFLRFLDLIRAPSLLEDSFLPKHFTLL
jgi:hypothetical protein